MNEISNIKMIKAKYYENSENKIYISLKRKKNNIKEFYYKRVKELINDKKYKELYICGIGACVNEAIKISLFITELIPSLQVSEIKTSTVNHFDEYIDINTMKRVGTTDDRKSNLISIKLSNTI